MDKLGRSFSKKELIIFGLLIIAILGFCYYYFIYVPVNEDIEKAKTSISEFEEQDAALQGKLVRLKKTEKELAALKKGKEVSIMPSYNGARLEINFLHDLMAPLGKFDFEFEDVTRTKDLIRRNFTLTFESSKYERIVNIFKTLYKCKYRVLINDVTYKADESKGKKGDKNAPKKMSLSGTFYETMIGAVEDEGLPTDENRKAEIAKAAAEAEAASAQ